MSLRTIVRATLMTTILCFSTAWSGHDSKSGELDIHIEEVPIVTQYETPQPVHIRLTNSGKETITGTVTLLDFVDDSHAVGDAMQPFSLKPSESKRLAFQIAFGKKTLSALYPVHASIESLQSGDTLRARAVRIVTTLFPAPPLLESSTDMPEITVPQSGVLPLWSQKFHRISWNYFDKPEQHKPTGWVGSDPESKAFATTEKISRSSQLNAISMHPPWRGGAGTIFYDLRLNLSPVATETPYLKLHFQNAIRDNSATEPASDGVLFRVWAGEYGKDPKIVFERLTDSKVWMPGEVSLEEFAGKTILLRLESHPGPKRNTVCDQSYWGEPYLLTAPIKPESPQDFATRAAENTREGREILAGRSTADNQMSFLLGTGENEIAAVLQAGKKGLLDGTLTLVGRNSEVSYNGFQLDILGNSVRDWLSPFSFLSYSATSENAIATHTHLLAQDGKTFPLTLTLWADQSGLRIAVKSPERITDFALANANQKSPVVYFGHGFRIVDPEPFRVGFGGHSLSTSHIASDYEGGLSVLQATDLPPDALVVEEKTCSLHTHMNATLTLVASEQGAFDAAIRYRPLYDKQPAGGVENLAGRFCFDIWGGSYLDNARKMEEMIRYGLTDSFLTLHVWQRWGYDYRLPDIWPPDPKMGSIADLRQLGTICDEKGIFWGLHDNYIDFYPDAEGYSYDDIAFTADGRPVKAWFNKGREAQSYRWRPDKFMPSLKRNLEMIQKDIALSHYFIDVFSSINIFDFYDQEGNFHPMTETQKYWGEAFAWIRDYLGNNAPTTSEAGLDQLTGWLDGADCQFIRVGKVSEDFVLPVPCRQWTRVPWFDAVNHRRFILHGAGYSSRYESGRDRQEHGINSDDYISAEILTGHALMVDRGSWGRDAVRKYYLAQDMARHLADKDILAVEQADSPDALETNGETGRVTIRWSDGTTVHVNRSQTDWRIGNTMLPPFGYSAQSPGETPILSTIRLENGLICEESRGPDTWYCNARVPGEDKTFPIRPELGAFRQKDNRELSWQISWQADRPAPEGYRPFIHFYKTEGDEKNKIVFQATHPPLPAPQDWQSDTRCEIKAYLPEEAEGLYTIGVGLYLTGKGERLALNATEIKGAGARTYLVGTLQVSRDENGKKLATFTPAPTPDPKSSLPRNINHAAKMVDFGFAITNGAFRIQKQGNAWKLTPLPESPEFEIQLNPSPFFNQEKIFPLIDVTTDTGETVRVKQEGKYADFRHNAQAEFYLIQERSL